MYGFIARWEHSGLSQKEFCKAEGVNYYKFKYWKTRQHQEQKSSRQKPIKPKPDFIPVSMSGFKSSGSSIEITFPNGVKLSCDQNMQPGQLIELIKLF